MWIKETLIAIGIVVIFTIVGTMEKVPETNKVSLTSNVRY